VSDSASCDEIVASYVKWLRDGFSVHAVPAGGCSIETPFLDMNNDHIEIFVETVGSDLRLTDDGYTVNNLQMAGVSTETPKRRQLLENIARGFGAAVEGDELCAYASRADVGKKKHALIQAILSANDILFTTREQSAELFKEEVEKFLTQNNILFVPGPNFVGKSTFTHSFDFAIPGSSSRPEILLRAMNNPNRNNISSFIFAWNDTREVRPRPAKAIAMLNDYNTRPITTANTSALQSYDIQPILWSIRGKAIEIMS